MRVDVGKGVADFADHLKEKGVLVAPASPTTLRFVTHRHIGPAEVEATLAAFRSLWRS